MKQTRSTCPYCGVGCGVVIESEGDRITGVRGDPDHPANRGRLCSKGSTLHLTAAESIARQVRLLQPMRRAARGTVPQATTWDSALDEAADRFAAVIAGRGPDAVGFYLSGQLLTEDYAAFNKLARALVGTPHIDSNSRLCMSSAVAGYRKTLGADAPPACYDDIDHAACLFIAGSNTAWAHPVLFRRIEDAKRADPALKIVVVDPRRTDTCGIADLHLALQPGTDLLLFHAMLHAMLWEGWTRPDWIAAHTSGFDALKAVVRETTPAHAARVCGVDEAAIVQAARWFATSPATLSLYCQGLNQSAAGTANNAALIGLHLATAQIGRPGAGPFSLTGQPNAMGGREVGAMATLLPGHRDPGDPAHRAEVARLWGVSDLPAQRGFTAVELFEAAADGAIGALWIACTNPAHSMPDQATVRRALERCEFVVLQDAYGTTATGRHADLLLPATTWGEKTGTITNSERRISRVRAAVPPPGQARHDWAIACDFGRRLERRLPARAGLPTLFACGEGEAGAEQLWVEHREATRGRDLDIGGLSWALIDARGPQQWPFPEGAAEGASRLYADGRFATPDGRARFDATPPRPVAEPCDARFPTTLNTVRLRDQWHGMSRTGTLGRLFGHAPEPVVQLAPADMARRGIADGELVELRSRRGSLVVPAQAVKDVAPGQACLPMHWGPEFVGGSDAEGRPRDGVNALTTGAFCPESKQPALKHAAVRVEKAALPWQLLALAWMPGATALAVQAALRELLPAFGHASCVPFAAPAAPAAVAVAGEATGLLFRAACAGPAPAHLLSRIESLLGLAGGGVLRYDDARRGQRRAARLGAGEGEGGAAVLEAFLLAGDTRAAAWMKPLLQQRLPVAGPGLQLLRPGAAPPLPVAPRGPIVCSCLGVDAAAIDRWLAAHGGEHPDPAPRRAALQRALSCGTGCGSCVPEIDRRVRQAGAAPRGDAAPQPEPLSLETLR